MKFSHLIVLLELPVPALAVSPVKSVAETLDRWRAGERVEVLRSDFLDVLALVPDPRDARGRRYLLAGLLAIAILATAAGMRGYAGFASWAATAPPEVLARLGIRFRRPSEKTFRSVLSRLDPADLDRRLGAYFTALAAAETGLLAVAVDGKTLRGARRMGAVAAHLVSVFAHHARLVLGQLAVTEKSNEIPCVRKLLRLFRNVRLLVTIDAMHTQTTTARLICGTLKSHYLMIVKCNQPKLLARIQALPWSQVPVTHAEPPQRCHGRIETRTLKVVTATRGIGFPHARQIIQVIREHVAGTGERSVEVVYAICSLPFEQARPPLIAAWLRDHWGIENAVHWVRDVTLDEDRSTVRTGTAPQVMASLRNTALNLHRLRGAGNIAEACRLTALSNDRGVDLLTDHRISSSQAC
jgi:predicted transposase YbfD/YdcC